MIKVLIVLLVWWQVSRNQTPVFGKDNQISIELIKTNKYYSKSHPIDLINGNKIELQMSVALVGLGLMNQMENKVVLKIVLRYRWYDQRLRWDPNQYGEYQFFQTKGDSSIWIPDLCIIQSYSKLMLPHLDHGFAKARYDGLLYHSRPGIAMISHEFQIKDYPYDKQNIKISFQSWTLNSQQFQFLDWDNSGVTDPKLMRQTVGFADGGIQQHLQWKVTNFTYQITNKTRQGVEYNSLDINVEVCRQGQTTLYIIYIPAMLLSVLGLFSYLIAYNDAFKIIFLTKIQLALSVLIALVTKLIPVNSDYPLIESFFNNLVISNFIIIISTILLQCYNQRYQVQVQKQNKTNHKHKMDIYLMEYQILKQKYKDQQLNQDETPNSEDENVQSDSVSNNNIPSFQKKNNDIASRLSLAFDPALIKQQILKINENITELVNQNLLHIQKKLLFKIKPRVIDRIGLSVFIVLFILYYSYTINVLYELVSRNAK